MNVLQVVTLVILKNLSEIFFKCSIHVTKVYLLIIMHYIDMQVAKYFYLLIINTFVIIIYY